MSEAKAEDRVPLTQSERFMLALSYMEAVVKDDKQTAALVQKDMTPHEFMAGVGVLSPIIFTLYEQKTGEGEELLQLLRQVGHKMKLDESR
jgi:hypothetical protein